MTKMIKSEVLLIFPIDEYSQDVFEKSEILPSILNIVQYTQMKSSFFSIYYNELTCILVAYLMYYYTLLAIVDIIAMGLL